MKDITDAFGFLIIIALSGALPFFGGMYYLFKHNTECMAYFNREKKLKEEDRKPAIKAASFLLPLLLLLTLSACTENQRAKQFGGTATVNLPKGTKFVGATWKEEQLWYIHRPARAGEVAETVTMEERSNFGLMEGKVIFVESN